MSNRHETGLRATRECRALAKQPLLRRLRRARLAARQAAEAERQVVEKEQSRIASNIKWNSFGWGLMVGSGGMFAILAVGIVEVGLFLLGAVRFALKVHGGSV